MPVFVLDLVLAWPWNRGVFLVLLELLDLFFLSFPVVAFLHSFLGFGESGIGEVVGRARVGILFLLVYFPGFSTNE